MKKEKGFKTISIPIELHQKIEKLIEHTGFHTVSGFAIYILRQILSEGNGKPSLSQAEKEVKKRLKNLGYL